MKTPTEPDIDGQLHKVDHIPFAQLRTMDQYAQAGWLQRLLDDSQDGTHEGIAAFGNYI